MRKKLFAILMSAMMMVTFMPAMAFAAESPEAYKVTWNEGLKSVTVGIYNATEKAYDNYTMTATPKYKGTSGMVEASFVKATAQAELEGYGVETAEASGAAAKLEATPGKYFDLTGAKLLGADGKIIAKVADKAAFAALLNADGTVKDTAVTGFRTYNNTGIAAEGAAWHDVTFDGSEEFKLTMTGTYDSASDAAQTGKLMAVMSVIDKNASYTAAPFKWVGTIAQDVAIAATKYTAAGVKVYVDKVVTGKDVSEVKATFDGNEHKLVTDAPAGFTVTWKQLNKATGSYDAVDAPSFKAAGTYFFLYSVKGTDATDTPVVDHALTVTVDNAVVNYRYTNNGAGLEAFKGLEINPYDYVEVVPAATVTTGDAYKAEKAVINAYKASLDEAFKAVYEVTATARAYSEDYVDLACEETAAYKAMTDAEKAAAAKALIEKYPELASITVNVNALENGAAIHLVAVTGNELVAGNQTKTFHVKKAKALKAKKTFQMKNDYVKVAGTASYFKKSGNAKIVIAKDGTVTVKKGLKKGTYKVKVKVTAANYPVQLSDTKVLKVKVVK